MDPDFDREAVTYRLESGAEGSEHVNHVLEYNQDATLTQDVDICPARDADNLVRLARALETLGARIRTESVPEGLPVSL